MHYAPEQFSFQKEDIWFESINDKTKLHGWFFPSRKKPPKGTVIQFHGNAQNISSHYLSLIWLVKHGYNLFTFDYRGYGKSKGYAERKGTVNDGIAAIQIVARMPVRKRGKKIILHGQSLGGAIALSSLSYLPKKNQISSVVIESSFFSYQSIAAKKLASTWILWPFQFLGYVLVTDEASPKSRKNQIPLVPALVAHGDKDPIVPFALGKKVYQELKGEKYFLKVKGGWHIDCFTEERLENRKKYLEFLMRFEK